jgi:hypothetical protein
VASNDKALQAAIDDVAASFPHPFGLNKYELMHGIQHVLHERHGITLRQVSIDNTKQKIYLHAA